MLCTNTRQLECHHIARIECGKPLQTATYYLGLQTRKEKSPLCASYEIKIAPADKRSIMLHWQYASGSS